MTNEELAVLIKAGHDDLTLQLWEGVKKWVSRVAVHWYTAFQGGRGVELADLIQSGYIAMLAAVSTFDGTEGAFTTWLTEYLRKEFSVTYGVRTERGRKDPINSAVPFDAPIGDDDDLTIADIVVDPDGENGYRAVEDADYIRALRAALEKALDDIPPKNADVLRRKYFGGQAQNDIADELGVTAPEVARRERKAFSDLRKPQTMKELSDFFDPYRCTGYHAWKNNGWTSVEEAFLLHSERLDRIRRHYIN